MNNDDELLTRYVNGKLEGNQRQRVLDALVNDPDLAREAELLQALKQGLQHYENAGEPPIELGLARLKRDIQQEQNVSDTPSPRKRRDLFWKGLAVAACLVVVVQTSLVVFTGSDDTQWELLSGGGASDAAPQLQVAFAPDTTIAQLEALLQPHAAHIIEGPGALGIYSLRLPEDSDAISLRDQLAESALIEEVYLP
ncbi:anti-sigma factor family protein [Halomonas tibetensis]|uniref:Anti-sigma factor family protein n=1 Tax=Halomonas tibetensis TaxID=2259590 RepID=A0ABV7AZH9_9GAMM